MHHTTSTTAPHRPSEVNTASLRPAVRVALVILLILASLFCAIGTLIISLTTAALFFAFYNYSFYNLFGALFGFFTFAGSAFLFSSLTACGIIFTHHLLKKQPISSSSIVIAIILFILTAIFNCVLLPLFGSLLNS